MMQSVTQGQASSSAEALPDGEQRHRRVRELLALLQRLADASSLAQRLHALERLVRWLTAADRSIPLAPDAGEVAPAWRRLAALLGVFARLPGLRAGVGTAIATVVAETDAVGLIAETGIPNDRGFMKETADRFYRRVLPEPRDEHDLARVLLRLFPSARELRWLNELPPELFDGLLEALMVDEPMALTPLAIAAAEALCLLTGRVQALGLSQAIRARSKAGHLRESPFFVLPRCGDQVLASLGN